MVVMEVDHKDLEMLIEKHYDTKLPLYIWGATGIGKSETVKRKAKELAKRMGREYIEWNKLTKKEKEELVDNPDKYFFLMDIRLSQLDPSDLRGLPALNGKDTVEWKIPMWLHAASVKGAMGVIFFDEINLAPPSIQSAAYQLILDRELGETPISDGVMCIAAGNRLEDKANVYDLPRPLQNRFDHVTLRIPTITQECKNDWGEWAMKNGVDMRIITFLIQRPTLLCPNIKENSNDRAFPTPRSWGKYCSKLISGVTDLNLIEKLASTSVGTGTASEFVSYLKFQRKINLEDIIKHPEKAKDITELDLKYSLLSLVAEWYGAKPKKENLETVLQIANVLQPEFAILLLRFVRNKHPAAFRKNVVTLKSWVPIAKKYQKYLIS